MGYGLIYPFSAFPFCKSLFSDKSPMNIEALREKAAMAPQKPGVYRMLDASGVVIYVGKAKNLKNRVSQYFQNLDTQWIKTRRLVSHIADFETIVTGTELEALMLENTLIKRYVPHYNILLKDDKGYPFIRFDPRLPYPRLELSMKDEAGFRTFGPYGGRTVAHEVIDTVEAALRLPGCSRRFPRDIGRDRPCLRHHLGRCVGVCTGEISPEQYAVRMNEAALLLSGRCGELIASLRQGMEEAAENLDFERAAALRDRIAALERLADHQKVLAANVPDADIVCLYNGAGRSCIAVLHYIDGTLLGKDQQFLPLCEGEDDERETLSQFLVQYYRNRPILPREVLLSRDLPDSDALSDYLTDLTAQLNAPKPGRRVYVLYPQRGEKKQLMDMALSNAQEAIRMAMLREERAGKGSQLLQQALGLEILPHRLEAYDISHTAGTDTVGSMVVFTDGKPRKSAYRRFKLSQNVNDDYGSMQEILTRRLTRAVEEDEKFLPLPDVLLVDGGAEHAAVAERVVQEFGFRFPVLGMVKDDSHRTRALIRADGSEIGIRTTPALFTLIGSIDEEAHRFAIDYHRSLRDASVRKSKLDGIPGVGEVRKKALLKHFGSLRAITAATEEELSAVVPKSTAKAVFEHLHPV